MRRIWRSESLSSVFFLILLCAREERKKSKLLEKIHPPLWKAPEMLMLSSRWQEPGVKNPNVTCVTISTQRSLKNWKKKIFWLFVPLVFLFFTNQIQQPFNEFDDLRFQLILQNVSTTRHRNWESQIALFFLNA